MENKELENLFTLLKNRLHKKKLYKITILAEILKSTDYRRLNERGIVDLFDDACLCSERLEFNSERIVPVLYKIYLSEEAKKFADLQSERKLDCITSLIDTCETSGVESLELRLKTHYLLKA